MYQIIGNAFNFANKNYFKGYNSSKTMLKVPTFFDFKFPISEIKDDFLGLRYSQCNSIEIMLKLVFFLLKMMELNEVRRSKNINAFSTQWKLINFSVAQIFAKGFFFEKFQVITNWFQINGWYDLKILKLQHNVKSGTQKVSIHKTSNL